MKKSHRIAIVQQAIENIEQHTHCMESYTRIYFEQYVRKCKHLKKDVNLDEFYELIPKNVRVLRAEGPVADPYDAELLEELQFELEALVPSIKKNASKEFNPDKQTV